MKWDSVDFDNGIVEVKHTVVQAKELICKDTTKTAASRRSFPLLTEIRDLLLDLKAQEDANRRLFGKAYDDNEYILKWDSGKPLTPDYVSKHFQKQRLTDCRIYVSTSFGILARHCSSRRVSCLKTCKNGSVTQI